MQATSTKRSTTALICPTEQLIFWFATNNLMTTANLMRYQVSTNWWHSTQHVTSGTGLVLNGGFFCSSSSSHIYSCTVISSQQYKGSWILFSTQFAETALKNCSVTTYDHPHCLWKVLFISQYNWNQPAVDNSHGCKTTAISSNLKPWWVWNSY